MANQYPQINAGSRITAGLLQSMIPVVVRKPSSTARTSQATVSDDPDLTYPLQANATYFVEFYIKYAAAAVTNVVKMQTAWNVPSGASGTRSCLGAGSSATDASADNVAMHTGIHGFNSVIEVYGGRSNSDSNQLLLVETSVITTTNSGACTFQWSQNASNATHAATVTADSFMRITRLA
ncbi:MAG: hypothetical protein ACRDS0_31530 [Pseudonocardiaceae bacterium]